MRPVKTLSAYSLFGFRFIAEEHLRDYQLISAPVYSKDTGKFVALSTDDLSIITQRFSAKKMWKAMVGKNDFAISYVTAEWLYDSLLDSQTIDLASIIMGYCKAVEQLLFQIIKFHADEEKEIKENNKSSKIKLTTDAINQFQVDTTWGSLTRFLSDYRSDLLGNITDDGQEYILVRLRQMNSKRNKYFHKENCYNWAFAKSIKDYVYQLIHVLLGAIQFTETQEVELGSRSSQDDDEYLRLCEYINYHAYRPCYIREKPDGELMRVLSIGDQDFICDKDGTPTYSGVYFRRAKTEVSTILEGFFAITGTEEPYCYTRNNLPYQIYSAEMRLVPLPDRLVMSGPQDILWEAGKFFMPNRQETIDY